MMNPNAEIIEDDEEETGGQLKVAEAQSCCSVS